MLTNSSRRRTPAGGSPATGRRTTLAVAVVVAAAIGAVPGIAAAAPAATPEHGMGLLPPTGTVPAAAGLQALAQQDVASGDAGSVAEALAAADDVPASVDLTPWAVPPGDQGQHGACASFTTGYTLAGWVSNYTRHVGEPFNPMFVYNQVNGGSDTRGTTFSANFRVLETLGDVESVYWTHPASDYRTQPTAAEKASAALHKLSAHTTLAASATGNLGPDVEAAIKKSLSMNQPVAIGLPVYAGFQRLTPSHDTFTNADVSGGVLGGHAVAVLGYDATGVQIENSWGAGWGDGGFATLGWDFVQKYVNEAYSVSTFASGQAALAPAVTALSSAVVTRAGGGSLTITAARVPTVDLSDADAVRFVSVADSSVAVPATVTASTGTTLTVTVPALPADGVYRVVLTGSGGDSAANGTVDRVTAAAPYSLVLDSGQVARSNVATKVTLVGTGFGTTTTAFTANKITATVNGKATTVTRVDDTHLQVLVPIAPAGSTASVVVSRNGLAGAAVAVPVKAPAPVVSKVTPARVGVAGGTSVTVTLKNAPTSAEATEVSLVSVKDPSVTVAAPITARTATSLTVTVPAAPSGAEGDYHLVVTNGGGASTPVTADVVAYRATLAVTTSATTASAAGGTKITLAGSGFGTTKAAFTANKITATVNGKVAPLTWIGDTALQVTLPAGVPGATASLALLHDSVPGKAVSTVTYAAVISAAKVPAGPTTGWTTTITGSGFARSTGWELTDAAGTTVAELPVVTSAGALAAAADGAVLIVSNTSATVHLPAGDAGIRRLAFTPDTTVNAAAAQGFTSQSVLVYSDLG